MILSLDEHVAIANSAKARVCYARGDFTGMILYKERAIAYARYSLEEYLDYFNMLQIGFYLYNQSGDTASAEFCRQKLLSIPGMLSEVEAGTSTLAWQIRDKPNLTLPEEYVEFLAALSK